MKEEKLMAIDAAIQQNKSFAIYRIPGENQLRFVATDNDAIHTYYDIEALNQQMGFVIAPFRISDECPILCLQGKEEILDIPSIMLSEDNHFSHQPVPQTSPGYLKRFHKFITPLRGKKLDKLVLSRQVTTDRTEDFSPALAFLRACQRYVRSYVYLFHTPQTGTWLGSTPEILLSGEKGSWYTAALAGTQPLINGKLPLIWSEKNYEEQQLVVTYIHNQLKSAGITPEEYGPYVVQAGELSHLKSDFRFSLPDNNYLGDLLKLLHPTPAVCGLPREEAYRFILYNEGYDRRYYSGFLGWLNPEGKSDLYVNLRCMEIEEKRLKLYAGGGLLPSSTATEEWQETEDKLRTMKALI